MNKPLFALVASAALVGSAHANLLINGSFENLENTYPGGGFATIGTGNTAITGWDVTAGSVDWINTYWPASQGSYSVDLSGNEPGTIAQTFATVAGQAYALKFDLSGNADGGSATKKVAVVAGDLNTVASYTLTGPSGSNYQTYSYTFTATGTSTTLSFASLSGDPFGASLDNASVEAVPEPATMAALGLGLAALARRRRKNG